MSFMLGSIRATLGLDESNFVRGMVNAEGAARIFGQGVVTFVNNPLLGTIDIMKSAAVSTFGLLKETAALNQEIHRTSERTGVSTKLISAMRKEFEDLNVSADAVEKAFHKFNERIANGAADFEALGISTRDANGDLRDTETLFREFTDRLAEMGTQAERTGAVQRFLGEEMLKVMQVVSGGSAGLDAITVAWTKLGHVLEADVARSSDIATTVLGKLIAAWQGFKATAATQFLAGLVGQTDNMSASVEDLAGAINEKLGPAARDAGEAVRNLIVSFKSFGDSPTLEGLRAAWELIEKIQNGVGGISDFLFDNPVLGWVLTPHLMLARDAFVDDAAASATGRGAAAITATLAQRRAAYESATREIDYEDALWWQRVQQDRLRRARASQ